MMDRTLTDDRVLVDRDDLADLLRWLMDQPTPPEVCEATLRLQRRLMATVPRETLGAETTHAVLDEPMGELPEGPARGWPWRRYGRRVVGVVATVLAVLVVVVTGLAFIGAGGAR